MNSFHRISGRGLIAYGHDIVMAAVSFGLSLYLRLGDDIVYYSGEHVLQAGIVFTVICAIVFWMSGLYRGVWRYASLDDLWAITRSVTMAVLIFLLVMFLWTRFVNVPRSLIPINWFVLMALLGGPRFFYRLFKDRRLDLSNGTFQGQRIAVLLVGAGDGAELFIRALRQTADANYRVVGIVSERPDRVGRQIHGVEVIGTADDVAGAVEKLKAKGMPPQRLVLTKDDMDGARVRALLDQANALGMTLARLPRLTDFRSGVSDKVEVRPIAVEDLLGRPQTALDRAAMARLIEGHRVLVTGAGGSIGGELVRQVSEFKPAEIGLLDHSEHALYIVDRETVERYSELPRRAVIADVRDRERLTQIFKEIRPELVFHAAALKHVPLVEDNVIEGAATNVLGTVNVADLAHGTGAKAMVLISTDKAVNPTSVMGATKRIAESYCQALDLRRGGTRFVTVRFGNVLGSTGSVVPLFQKQLAAGGPLTVTHPDMTRYFMTVREAVELVLQASALGIGADAGNGRRDGKIFVLEMGEPIRIMDLAEQMIRLAGFKPGRDVKIEVIGPRPGEKLFEEVFHGSEAPVPTECPGVLLAAPRAGDARELAAAIAELREACRRGDRGRVLALIRRLVPEYHQERAVAVRAASV
ncbi:MAG: polysaccharide biosynthesis protein [Rhodospirillales bacterium]|nr:polysaccharide biosynthesis protein [Rhodospirillales bacterium]